MRIIGILICVLFAALPLPCSGQPVLSYYFTEGQGTVLHDSSGNKYDGTVKGEAKWVSIAPGRHALRLNGQDTYIDCGTLPSFGTQPEGTIEVWVYLEAYQGGLLARSTGGSNEDQRLVLSFKTYYGDDELIWVFADGDRYGMEDIPKPPLNQWTYFVLTFKSGSLAAYINGKRVKGYGKSVIPDVKGVPLRIGFSEGLASPGKDCLKGMIAEVKLDDHAMTPWDISSRFQDKAKSMGLGDNLIREAADHLTSVRIDATSLADRGQVSVEMSLAAFWPDVAEDSSGPVLRSKPLTVSLMSIQTGKVVRKLSAQPSLIRHGFMLDMTGLPDGEYQVSSSIANVTRSLSGPSARFKWVRPQTSGCRTLNNLVLELLNEKDLSGKTPGTLRFTNPRDGWVFISAASSAKDAITLSLGRETIITLRAKNNSTEAMRFLPKGDHELKVTGKGRLNSVVVRAIPEIMYSDYPLDTWVKGFGPYDWSLLKKHVLPNANCIVATPALDEKHKAYVKEWKDAGKRWVSHAGVPGKNINTDAPLEKAVEYWSGHKGFQDPFLGGVIVDEFAGGSDDPMYTAWAKALDDIYHDEKFRDRVFYAYTYGSPMYDGKASSVFADTVVKHGGAFSLEYYIPDGPSIEAVSENLSWMRDDIERWKKARPHIMRHIIMNLGYLAAPTESMNVNPKVDFKVFMDRFMNLVANDPTFMDLYGLAWYKSSYADEETLRWGARLFRHYCIEGKKNMLSDEYGYSYNLSHLRNPDFTDGMDRWTIAPAENGSIFLGNVKGWGYLQGRYLPVTYGPGDQGIVTRRSPKTPNRFSQEIRNLKPGKLYSLKFYAADYQDLLNGLSKEGKYGVSVKIDDAEIIPAKSFQEAITNHPGRVYGKYPSGNLCRMNYWRLVFRAKGRNARLGISDWEDEKHPGGPTGQELIYNFFEVQPYFE